MEEKELSENESLQLITEMIGKAQKNYRSGGSFHFLLWGWVVMLANLAHYLLMIYSTYEHPYIVWLATFPAGIISAIYGARQSNSRRVKTHFDSIHSQVWIAASVGIFISILFMGKLSFNHNCVILLFAGIGTYITGNLLRFKPLIAGGVSLALASVIAFNVSIIDQYLVAAVGIFLGYIIPGYMLKKKEK
ncbi:MAG: hypothetical protein JXR10_15145 [Cyclobacteriaceae bacterium]